MTKETAQGAGNQGMEALLQQRRIRLWELVCQQYSLPKGKRLQLDAIIRRGEVPEKRLRNGVET